IDTIIVTTPEHWHAQVAIDAMEAGKHVYCEKPMTRYLNEAFALYDAQRRTGKVVQVGSQGCSDAKWWTAGRAVADGKIGQVVDAQGSYTRNSTDGEWNYYIDPSANPSNLDWSTWLGTAPERPWTDEGPSRFFQYRKFRDYSAGLLGDLLPHKAHPLMIALFLDKPEFPVRVTTLGTRKISTDREVADNIHIVAEFATGATMYFLLSTVNEQGMDDLIRGHKATIYFGGGKVQIKPERAFGEDVDQQDIPVVGPGEDTNVHRADWFNCIRTGKIPNCNVDLAVKTQTLESMAEMSELGRRTLYFDPAKREVSWKPGVDYLKEIPKKA
ncbi:MAG: Gfo/Idh/MocA family oxidoreductase, partial [Chloroflexi bacterium]|nr:Gfo/Idh/MocA family oxidoreductase [Chloroflexota bacterium]